MNNIALVSSAEEQMKNFGIFLDDHDKKLSYLTTCVPPENVIVPSNPLVEISYSTNEEEVSLLHLLKSDRGLNKTLLTFAHMCSELAEICNEARILQTEFQFLDENVINVSSETKTEDNNDSHNSKELILLRMSESIDMFYQVHFLLQRCSVLFNGTLHQCGAFLSQHDNKSNLQFKFNRIFDELSNLLLQIVIFDEIIQRSNFIQLWPQYKQYLEAILNKPEFSTEFTNSHKKGLQNCIQELGVLFSGAIFRNFMDSTFMLKDRIGPRGMNKLSQQTNGYIKQKLIILQNLNFDTMDDDISELTDGQQLVSLNAYFAVMHAFCDHIETRHVKHLLELNAKHQGIVLLCNISWLAAPFLYKHAESLVQSHVKLLQEEQRQRQGYLQMRLKMLPRDMQNYRSLCNLWVLDVNRALRYHVGELKVKHFKDLATLLLRGMRYIGKLVFFAKALIRAHIDQKLTMSLNTLVAVCSILEIINMLQDIFQQHNTQISNVMHCIINYMQYKLFQHLALAKKNLANSKVPDHENDALNAVKIAEKCMCGPATKNRLLVTQLANDFMNGNNRIFNSEQQKKIYFLLQRLKLLSEFQEQLRQMIDNSFIYWHQTLLSSYLKQIVDRRMDFHAFQHLLKSTTSCNEMLHRLQLNNLPLSQLFSKSTYESLRTEIISKLCAEIETFLRLEVHANLKVDQMSPFAQSATEYRELLNQCPLIINNEYIILKDHVENYLGTMFYNLTTISLHDWKTYEEMRHLANSRLDLHPVEDYLPNQTLNQGIDILEIMRKIHIFVTRYVYNMNAQLFVEQNSSSKHLETIGIEHVANSLRTHGYGVINTTVNFTYQFLRQKFYTFSQFLFDEKIRSRLMKELRIYAECKQNDTYPLYSYERAETFNKDMRKLGLADKDLSYMDLFRLVITHVGNAMGYIRLVRSGSMNATYSASLYLPKFDDKLQFDSKCIKLNVETKKAAQNFERNIQSLEKSFSDSMDYFKLLVQAFQPFMLNPNNLHLKNFFLILPPLIMNYVEYMIAAKEKVNKKDVRQEAVLFDDGFIIGLAYILQLTQQIPDFNSLQWFTTVREHFDAERSSIQTKLEKLMLDKNCDGNEREKLQQTLAFTDRRISAHQTEYNLFYYNLSSAKIFFQ